MPEHELRFTQDRAQADDWALALSAEGIAARISREVRGYAVWVSDDVGRRADILLRAYEAENAPDEQPQIPTTIETTGLAPINAALATTTAMICFYVVTGPREPGSFWFESGSADAARILAGEVWRCATALSLHADLAHLMGNVIFGTFFLAALGRSLGPGVALALALLAGVGGNFVNAAVRSSIHISVGASTAVFGAVGVLSGFGVVRRWQRGEGWRRVGVPLMGGLGLLAMLGSAGDRVDIWAHLFGLAFGVPLGAGAGLLTRKPPGAAVQWLLAWTRALEHLPGTQ
jgi:membrane associated rhomboid family serine protease